MTHPDPNPPKNTPAAPGDGSSPLSASTLPLGRIPDRVVDRAIEHALASPNVSAPPPGFAGRVARLAVQQPLPLRLPWLGWGPRLTLLSGLLLTVAMFVVAPHTVPSLADARFDTELLLLAELAGLLLFAPRLLPSR